MIANANFFRGRSTFTGNHNQIFRCIRVQERNIIEGQYLLLFVSSNVYFDIEILFALTFRFDLSI